MGKMASGGGESSENIQDIPPNEDETTVNQNAEGIVAHFMVRRHQRETQRAEEHGEIDSPSARASPDALEELRSHAPPSPQSIQDVATQLEEVGDEIYVKYRKKFRNMADALSLTPGMAYESFAAVARRLFRTGINWGRVIALLCFGYEFAERRSFSVRFVRIIIRFVVDFIFKERIASWIAENGGWVRLTVQPHSSICIHIWGFIVQCVTKKTCMHNELWGCPEVFPLELLCVQMNQIFFFFFDASFNDWQ